MSARSIFLRAGNYLKRHGLAATVRRGALSVRRWSPMPGFTVFRADLADLEAPATELPEGTRVEPRDSDRELTAAERESLYASRTEALEKPKLSERFQLGATLWFLYRSGSPAGMVWTIPAAPVRPYYFPFHERDVHMFDNEVFEEYRGRGINTLLVGDVLGHLRRAGYHRVFIETNTWNEAEIRSLRKTAFRPIGTVRQMHILGRAVTSWKHASD